MKIQIITPSMFRAGLREQMLPTWVDNLKEKLKELKKPYTFEVLNENKSCTSVEVTFSGNKHVYKIKYNEETETFDVQKFSKNVKLKNILKELR